MLLLSEHRLCKESFLIVRKFDFEILTDLYVLRFPGFIYAIFALMYVCMCVCVCMCVWVNTIASKRYIRLSSNLVCILQVTIGQTLLILVNVGWIVFFTEVQKRIFIHYGLWSQILQSVLASKWWIRLSSNLIHILLVTILHIVANLMNLKLIFFYRNTKKNSYTLQPTESDYKK